MSSNLKSLIERIAGDVVTERGMSKKVHAKLVKVSPPTFRLYDNLEISGAFVITPKYRVFTEDDIGHDFIFEEDYSGQQFIYCYEAAPTGENGVAYKWQGKISACNLIGKCPHGEVIVTHGTIEEATHERGINK